jgi:hypothetical protein
MPAVRSRDAASASERDRSTGREGPPQFCKLSRCDFRPRAQIPCAEVVVRRVHNASRTRNCEPRRIRDVMRGQQFARAGRRRAATHRRP